MSLSTKIILALVLGIAVGLFLGEKVEFLHFGAEAFILLLQMSVLPYIVVSLIAGLGGLTIKQAKTLASKGGLILLLLWGLTIGVVLLTPLAFPVQKTASFFSTTMIQELESVDFLRLYIPANPFNSLANTTVPAVVFFSVAMGLALMVTENKSKVIDGLKIIKAAIARIIQYVVKLSPLGIFAIAGHAAGTMGFQELKSLEVYAILFIVFALVMAFWVLPGLVTVLTPIGYSSIIRQAKGTLATAFLTGNLLIVLPLLIQKGEDILKEFSLAESGSKSKLDVIVSTSFNFPSAGKLILLMFIPFAGWFVGSELSVTDYPVFSFMGLCTFFGSVNVAVPFLFNIFHIPADMFQMFISMSVVHSRFTTMVGAMHILVLGLLVTCAINGTMKISGKRLFRYVLVSVFVLTVTLGGSRYFFSNVFTSEYTKDKILAQMQLQSAPVNAIVHKAMPEALGSEDADISRLQHIQKRGLLRIGYLRDSLPYAYKNAAGDLVGFDIDMSYQLATDLGVNLEFIQLDRQSVGERINNNYCDILMSGFVITPRRAAQLSITDSYMNETLAFVVKDYRRKAFRNVNILQRQRGIKIGLYKGTFNQEKIQKILPNVEIVQFNTADEFFEGNLGNELDGVIVTAERGSAWCLRYPEYSVAIPRPDIMSIPLSYVVPEGDQKMLKFMNTWIDLKKKDKTVEKLYNYWILGHEAEKKQPRWCIIRNVLKWID
ncbi:MAG: cation:dicarboxylate symporter family transporter [Planctomycetota bacterium]|jgi:Na+/H+-dicarboxylate symporter